METKIARLKAAYADGDYAETLRIAARFPRLGVEKEPITRAWAALQNPAFYRDLGLDPDELVVAGIAAVRRRYRLP
jgi:hypothetical protein